MSRRRLAELGAAAGVVVVALALVGATLVFRPSDTAPPGPGLPAPTEESVELTEAVAPSSLPRPGPRSTSSSPIARLPGRPLTTLTVPPVFSTGTTPSAAVTTTRAPAPVPPPPSPRPSTPSPTPSPTPTPTPSPTPMPSPTDTEPPP